MICPECEKEKKSSRTSVLSRSCTRDPVTEHWKDGLYHRHDLNTYTVTWACSRGHKWDVDEVRLCWCQKGK